MLFKIKNFICNRLRKRFIYPSKEKKEGGKTIICNNCTGAMMLHDLGYRLDTPTVNLWMNTRDYMKLINSLPDVLFKEIKDITPPNASYPIGLLNDCITLHFMHYSSFSDAVTQWRRRAARIDMNNIYLLCIDNKDDGIELDFKSFDKLPYKNKIAITNDKRVISPSSRWVYYDPNKNQYITSFSNWFGKRFYDSFDFESFLS